MHANCRKRSLVFEVVTKLGDTAYMIVSRRTTDDDVAENLIQSELRSGVVEAVTSSGAG